MTVTGLRPGAGGTPRGDASGALRRRLGGVLVDTGAGCNLGCRFCPMEPGAGDPDTAQVVAALDVARDAGAERVILVGGEPTIRRDLGAITAAVAARGLRLGLVTNGRMFAYGTVLDLLRGHGLDVLTVGLHGPDAAVHDALVGAPGAFKQTVAGLRAVAAHADIAVEVRAVVGPENLRALAGLVGLVRRLFTGRAQVRLTLAAEAPGAAGRARGGAPAEAHAAAAAMRAALVLAQSVGLPAGSTGLPDCVAADLLLARALAPDRRRLGPVARASCLPDPRLDGAGFTLACAECVRRPECPGPAPRAAVPVRGLRRGSHDLVPVGELAPFAPAPRDCPGAAQARAAGADPARDLLFADGGRVALYRAAGADVPHGELERLGTTEQYYLEPEAPGGARRAVRLAAACHGCAERPRCPGCGEPRPALPDAADREGLAALVAAGRVLVVRGGAAAVPAGALAFTLAPDESAVVAAAGGPPRRLRDLAPAASLDTVLALDVVNRLFDAAAALRDLTGLLRPGGRLVVVDEEPCAVLTTAARAEERRHALECFTRRRSWGAAELGELVRQAELPFRVEALHPAGPATGPAWSLWLKGIG